MIHDPVVHYTCSKVEPSPILVTTLTGKSVIWNFFLLHSDMMEMINMKSRFLTCYYYVYYVHERNTVEKWSIRAEMNVTDTQRVDRRPIRLQNWSQASKTRGGWGKSSRKCLGNFWNIDLDSIEMDAWILLVHPRGRSIRLSYFLM